MNDNVEAKKFITPEQRRKAACLKRINSLLKYLKEQYNVQIPDGTTRKMLKCAYGIHWPTKKTVDALIKEWHLWEEYLSEDSYSPFVLSQLAKLFKIQASAVSESPELKSYVGAIEGVTVVKTPPRYYSTSLGLANNLKLNGENV